MVMVTDACEEVRLSEMMTMAKGAPFSIFLLPTQGFLNGINILSHFS
jgi:hypothetical protein